MAYTLTKEVVERFIPYFDIVIERDGTVDFEVEVGTEGVMVWRFYEAMAAAKKLKMAPYSELKGKITAKKGVGVFHVKPLGDWHKNRKSGIPAPVVAEPPEIQTEVISLAMDEFEVIVWLSNDADKNYLQHFASFYGDPDAVKAWAAANARWEVVTSDPLVMRYIR